MQMLLHERLRACLVVCLDRGDDRLRLGQAAGAVLAAGHRAFVRIEHGHAVGAQRGEYSRRTRICGDSRSSGSARRRGQSGALQGRGKDRRESRVGDPDFRRDRAQAWRSRAKPRLRRRGNARSAVPARCTARRMRRKRGLDRNFDCRRSHARVQ